MKYSGIWVVVAAGLVWLGCATEQKRGNGAFLKSELQLEDQRVAKEETQLKMTKTTDQARIERLTEANKQLSKELQDELKKNQVKIRQLEDQLTLSLVEEVLFDSGKAELREEGKAVLDKVIRSLQGLHDQVIMVEGHTDNVPISPTLESTFPTNWELSTARATTVVRYLQDKGIRPEELGAAGFGEYRPVASNNTPEGRQQNRRIDVVLTPKSTNNRTQIASNE